MSNDEKLAFWMEEAKKVGFEAVAPLDADKLVCRTEVRDMCAVNQCGCYGTTWSCPPACGSIESCSEKITQFQRGFLVQTIGEIEDSLDIESIMEIGERHAERFRSLALRVKEDIPSALALGAGTCKVCSKCAYPEPCRFPEKAFSSMEAFGLVVSDTCTASGVPYYYGATKLANTGCFLLF